MKNKLILFLIFFQMICFANVFEHKQNLKYIISKVPSLNDCYLKFSQDKYIESSNIHLKSYGNFEFKKDKGITFYIEKPIKSTVSYQNREYKQINSIITAISNKNYSKIEKDFNFFFSQNDKNWDLGLKPKEKSKAYNYISSIEIIGKNDISKIIIITTDKTKTTINFYK